MLTFLGQLLPKVQTVEFSKKNAITFLRNIFWVFEWFDLAKVITNYIFRAVNLHLFANDKFKPPIWNNEIYAVANYVFRPAIALAHGQKVCYQIFILCSYTILGTPFLHICSSTDNCEWNFDSIVFWSDKKTDFDTFKQNGNV